MIDNPFEDRDDRAPPRRGSAVVSYVIAVKAGGCSGGTLGVLFGWIATFFTDDVDRVNWMTGCAFIGIALGVGYLLSASSTAQSARSRA